MKILVARVTKAEVFIEGRSIASIGRGIVLFVGINKGDKISNLEAIAKQVANLRIFPDSNDKLNYSLVDKGYSVLCISNFTLSADFSGGRRPSFEKAMPFAEAEEFFKEFIQALERNNLDVKAGVFGKHMDISLELDGPMNIILDKED